ncbi:MAG: lipocalin family protein [Gammaproteobacteria bacterium]|nr:lipocalin family protein [Gammaproteobacteria bacterium]
MKSIELTGRHPWNRIRPTLLVACLSLLVSACTGLPENVTPVDDFELNRYLGKWYEIARLDHRFERGLSQVTADYALLDNGDVKVVNRGFSSDSDAWEQVEGKARFVGDETTAHLKVSFFGPFYSSYVVFELDQDDYQHAFVAGYNTSYLWLLSRTPEVSDELVDRFVKRAGELGFDTEKLILVEHTD